RLDLRPGRRRPPRQLFLHASLSSSTGAVRPRVSLTSLPINRGAAASPSPRSLALAPPSRGAGEGAFLPLPPPSGVRGWGRGAAGKRRDPRSAEPSSLGH